MKALAIVILSFVVVYNSRTHGIAPNSVWVDKGGKQVTVLQVRAGFVYFTDNGYIDGTMFKLLYARIH